MTFPLHNPPVFPDPFAIEWGHDEYGTFQSFAVGSVVQRMRWIPPGRFIMGSPENEVGRFGDEFQHQVNLSQGYWLADTPVMQALWQPVMGTNPSQFNGPNNPVEQVSWDDCRVFIARLNKRIQGLDARLPTEEEWEYACRAGTKIATWAGDFQLGEETLAPTLEPVAWYVGNAERGTHAVAQKQLNPWGLYDMLGNVWEWCRDQFDYYANDPGILRDPLVSVPNSMKSIRVLRGGSWNSPANFVRAACRYASTADCRSNSIGLRIAASSGPTHRRR